VYTVFVSSALGAPGEFVVRLDGDAAVQVQNLDASAPAGAVLSTDAATAFRVAANPDSPLVISVNTVTPGFAFTAALRDPDGETVSTLNGADGDSIITALPPDMGDYVLEVRPTLLGTTGEVVVSLGVNADVQPLDTTVPTPDVVTSVAVCEVSAISGVNVRSGPGREFSVLQALAVGTFSEVIGISEDGNWYAIAISTPDASLGWVAKDLVPLRGSCDSLAIVTLPSQSLESTATLTATSLATEIPPTATPTVFVEPATSTPTPTPTIEIEPTTAMPSDTPTPRVTETPTVTPSPTATLTPTTPPPPQSAPEDAGSNGPLTIDLDDTESVSDFVSFPDGDSEDRVAYSVSGMNNNVAITGGRAQLIIIATCVGVNIDQIQFVSSGQTYACGETIVDREVTADSNTGSIFITASGDGTSAVQWTLTGATSRTN
ncbi:MAG: SH3 domain-containing protein, partial [Chloroflexota bacterium]